LSEELNLGKKKRVSQGVVETCVLYAQERDDEWRSQFCPYCIFLDTGTIDKYKGKKCIRKTGAGDKKLKVGLRECPSS
jgi:hypothetical protein